MNASKRRKIDSEVVEQDLSNDNVLISHAIEEETCENAHDHFSDLQNDETLLVNIDLNCVKSNSCQSTLNYEKSFSIQDTLTSRENVSETYKQVSCKKRTIMDGFKFFF